MRAYDYIVAGSGITGLTIARLLSLRGAKVLLLEKARTLGGSAARFSLKGTPFDGGFHFTAGFAEDGSGVLDEMLRVLGIRGEIVPRFYSPDNCHRVILPSAGVDYALPSGVQRLQAKVMQDFPRERDGIALYFDRMRHVVAKTPTLQVSGLTESPPLLDEDGITAREVLDSCISDPVVRALLSSLCMCYGSRLDEISFANHARICYGLHETVARVDNNGQAFVDALVRALQRDGVEIRTGTTISQLGPVENRVCSEVILSDQEAVKVGRVVLTMHPRHILELLPPTRPAFRNRVLDCEESIAFFAVFAKLAGQSAEAMPPITSVFPDLDLDGALRCHSAETRDGPLVVIGSRESVQGAQVETASLLEVSFARWTQQWANSEVGRRPADYYAWKQQRVDSILRRLRQNMPEYATRVQVMDAASNLTFRDYLNSPEGSAYGIRHRPGEIPLLGRLPVANFYAAGQSTLLPGIIGAMTSAYLVCRMIVGPEAFEQLLERRNDA